MPGMKQFFFIVIVKVLILHLTHPNYTTILIKQHANHGLSARRKILLFRPEIFSNSLFQLSPVFRLDHFLRYWNSQDWTKDWLFLKSSFLWKRLWLCILLDKWSVKIMLSSHQNLISIWKIITQGTPIKAWKVMKTCHIILWDLLCSCRKCPFWNFQYSVNSKRKRTPERVSLLIDRVNSDRTIALAASISTFKDFLYILSYIMYMVYISIGTFFTMQDW